MSFPLVSILIPTYEYARFLPEAIESVLAQDLEDFELIIADDASSDNTAEVCQKYVEKDSRVQFFKHEKNLGMVQNWNWCMERAKGEYIKPLLADDKLNGTDALRRLLDGFSMGPDVALVTSSRQIMDEHSDNLKLMRPLGTKDRLFSGVDLIDRCLAMDKNLIGEPTAVLFRRRDAERGFDLSYRQLVDLEMWFYLIQNGSMAYVGDPLCCFRKHSLQQTAVNRENTVGKRESLAILGYSNRKHYNRYLFRRIYKLKKAGGQENCELAAKHQQQFGAFHYLYRCVEYRLLRLVDNAVHHCLK